MLQWSITPYEGLLMDFFSALIVLDIANNADPYAASHLGPGSLLFAGVH